MWIRTWTMWIHRKESTSSIITNVFKQCVMITIQKSCLLQVLLVFFHRICIYHLVLKYNFAMSKFILLLSTSSFLHSVLICPLFQSQHAYIGFLAWLERLLESGPPGPKRVPYGRPVKQTNKQTKSSSNQ